MDFIVAAVVGAFIAFAVAITVSNGCNCHTIDVEVQQGRDRACRLVVLGTEDEVPHNGCRRRLEESKEELLLFSFAAVSIAACALEEYVTEGEEVPEEELDKVDGAVRRVASACVEVGADLALLVGGWCAPRGCALCERHERCVRRLLHGTRTHGCTLSGCIVLKRTNRHGCRVS